MNTRSICSKLVCCALLGMALAGNAHAALTAIWQYQVPVTPPYVGTADPERRAYLWIPPSCTQVKGLVVGLQNMAEQPMFEDPTIRNACAAANLAIVWIAPGYATPDNVHPNMCLTLDPGNSNMLAGAIPSGKTADQQCADELAAILTQLANKSGYTEIQYAPMILVGHSAATPFVWSRSVYNSGALVGRVIALLPYKGWYPGNCPRDIPIFHVSSEWEEVDNIWGLTWSNRDMPSMKTLRAQASNCLLGEFVQPGTGHYNYPPEASGPMATFIQEVAAKRLPVSWSGTSKPTLTAIAESSGYLIDPAQFGTTGATPVSYSSWVGSGKSSTSGYWYISQATAQAVCNYMNPLWGKKPQMINVYQDPNHTLAPISETSANGNADYTPTLASDGVTFTMSAAYLTTSPTTRLYSGLTLGNSSTPILFKPNGSSGLMQTGTNTFQVWIGRNSISRQGLPWEPFVIAYNTGDGTYRGADRPAHIQIATRNTAGTAQTITFPAIPNQSSSAMQNITLNATASSGRGVQYWVVSGPYQINGMSNVLVPTTIPPKTKFPMEVVIGAYQWGQKNTLQSAGPVFSTFYVTASTASLPSPWVSTAVGTVGTAGSATAASGVYTVKGAGSDLGGTADSCQYVYQTLTGDGAIAARIASETVGGTANDKVGLMMRESTSANAIRVAVVLDSSSGKARLAYRSTAGGATTWIDGPSGVTTPRWLRLVRSGSTFTGSVSTDGSTWTQVGSISVTMASSATLGMAVCSRDNASLNTTTFDNVTATP